MKSYLKTISLIVIVSVLISGYPAISFATTMKIVTIKDFSEVVSLNNGYSLPKTVTATMSNNTTHKFAVTWNPKTADTSKIGTYIFMGTVKGYAKKVKLTLKVEKAQTKIYNDPELARAVSLGIGSYAPNKTVTYKQFFSMLDSVIKLSNTDVYKKWIKELPKARISNNTMKREEGMLATYLAAKALGADYNATDSEWWKINEIIGEAWNQMSWNYPLLSGWDEPVQLDSYKWNNHMVAAYFFSMGRTSKLTDETIFDYDSRKNSMRPSEAFTYEEALYAAVRLYYSGIKVTDRVLSSEDKKILNLADQRRNAILNSKTTVKITGTAYYVSNSGNDNNDGLKPETAWATIAKVNRMDFKPGDGIFFERGGLWREIPKYRDSITYSAYGEGPKPKIYGSPENGADPKKWSLLEGSKNIWVFYRDMYDTGCIVFNDGESWATRKNALWNGSKYVELLDKSKPIDIKKLDNLNFISLPDYSGYSTKEAKLSLDKKGKLYLRCDAGNPGSIYSSIEFLSNPMQNENGGEHVLVHVGVDSVVDNLCLMYGNQCGIFLSGNSTVQNCELAWIGGCILEFNSSSFLGQDVDAAIRAGDGITMTNGSNNLAINNYIHHIYDNGLAEETGPWYSDKDRNAQNNTYKGNLVEYCSGGLCIADWASIHTDTYNKPLYSDFIIEDNYFMYTGYGWSHQGSDEDWGQAFSDPNMGNSSIYFAFPPDTCTNINVINNVFYLSKFSLVGGREMILPDRNVALDYDVNFSGNTYVQNTFGLLATWGKGEEEGVSQKYNYNLYAQKTVHDVLGDKTGFVLPLDK